MWLISHGHFNLHHGTYAKNHSHSFINVNSLASQVMINMLSKKDIDRLLKANPELVGKKLFSCQQRISFLLELLNEMNEQMLQIRLKELAEEDKS